MHVCGLYLLSLRAQEPFTYIDRVGEDKEHFLRWLQQHEECMQSLRQASNHMWFNAYCMLNDVTLNGFLDPSSAMEMLVHWKGWVAEQEPGTL